MEIDMKNKFPLGFFPTPLHSLDNLSKKYPAYTLFMKRDDQSGLATGGNKVRKLEYLIREALDQGCDTFVTAGAQQSNHCRQTAAAAVKAGMTCHLLLRGEKPEQFTGNLLLSHLLGAHIHYTGSDISEENIAQLMDQLTQQEKKPYYTPIGGSSLTGAMGFVDAMGELKQQMAAQNIDIDYIFFASSSGGTQAGMVLGKALHEITARLMPVSIDKNEISQPGGLQSTVLRMVTEGGRKLQISQQFTMHDVQLLEGYGEAGYGVITDNERNAIRELACTEGIFLDPVYTARAFYGMTDMLSGNSLEPGANILFWHTGGIAANFHYASDLLQSP